MAWNFFCKAKMSVAGKHVLITGGSQGLGLAFAKLCFTRGARVTIVSRTKAKLEQACDEIRSQSSAAGGKVQYLEMDVSNMKCINFSQLMGRAADTFGRVDVVVANAGTGVAKLLIGPELSDLDELMEAQISTNLLGSLRCAIAAGQVMASDGQGGRICIVSSAAGLISLPGYSIYSATKFGHRGFLAGAYHELRRHGVHLSVYYPGSINTPGFLEEKRQMPPVTLRIESQCSDVSSPESVAAMMLSGIERGTREITNELLPSLVVDSPTGCAPVDAIVAAVTQLIRAGWSQYLHLMAKWYVPNLVRQGD
ncbi:TSC10A [Symbiodinium natans]|uniref:TSC10A protein n=1 Tax=Symbiodinium natans TaxID=878477 RepID=A0A812U313_9DINO|nr:TSC10A [Symbiodinium natans]